jgi:3-oxoadipate enol-lactonase
MQQAGLNGIRIYWREDGAGEPIVFLHAFPLSARMWDAQLSALPAGWRGIAPDLRGFGRTTAGTAGPHSMELMAEDVVALLDHLNLRHAVFCGLSMGGYVAFALLRKHPDRVRGLILANTRAAADTAESKQSRAELAARVRAQGTRAVVEAMLSKLLSDHAQADRPELVSELQQLMMANQPEQVARALEGIAERPAAEDLFAGIHVPVLVIHSDEDAIIPTGEAQIMARGIRGARLQMVHDAGHISNLEHPAVFSSYIADFLQHLPPALPIDSLKLA